MTKFRLDFEADEWLSAELETYQNKHPELTFRKDLLQGFILDLKGQLQYFRDMAEKPFEGSSASSVRQDSPSNEQKTSTAQQPEVLAPSSDVHTLAIAGKTYRISETQKDRIIWKDGQMTFSLKHAEHLAFMEAAAKIQKDVEEHRTKEEQKRAIIKADMHREIAIIHKRKPAGNGKTGEIIDATPWGAPVDEYIR